MSVKVLEGIQIKDFFSVSATVNFLSKPYSENKF